MILAHQKLILLMAFVAICLAFMKLKSGYNIYTTRGMRLMRYGSWLLIFGAASGLIGSIGIFSPGYTKSLVFFMLESVVGYVSGWALIIWGMSEWLPYFFSVSGRLTKNNRSLKIYESLIKLSGYGDASPATFKRMVSVFLETHGYQAATLHIPDKNGQLTLFSSTGLSEKSCEKIKIPKDTLFNRVFDSGEVYVADESARLPRNMRVETKSGFVEDALCLPVNYGPKRIGVMTIYTDAPRLFTREELAILDSLTANIGLTFYNDGLSKSLGAHKAFKDFIAVILKTSRSDDSFNTRIIRLARLLKQHLKFNTMHLYLIGNGAPQRLDFNLPGAAKVVIEKGFFSGIEHKHLEWIVKTKRNLILPDESAALGREIRTDAAWRTLYTPIVISGDVVGVLGLTLPLANHFTRNDLIASNAIASVVAGSLLEETNKKITDESLDRIGAVNYALETIASKQPMDIIFNELARVIVEKTSAAFCRIMLLNSDQDKIRTLATHRKRETTGDKSVNFEAPVSDLPLINRAINSGKSIAIKGSESNLEISKRESPLLFHKGISQVLITPIIFDGKARGTVIIGDSRSARRARFGPKDIVFAQLLANVISMLTAQNQGDGIAIKPAGTVNRIGSQGIDSIDPIELFHLVDTLGSKINGPLAGIMASCEYLRSKPGATRKEIERYLAIINKNASKIHKLAGQFAEARREVETLVEKSN